MPCGEKPWPTPEELAELNKKRYCPNPKCPSNRDPAEFDSTIEPGTVEPTPAVVFPQKTGKFWCPVCRKTFTKEQVDGQV
jgi:hypothetical protein